LQGNPLTGETPAVTVAPESDEANQAFFDQDQ
jgi:hypothetical protein